MRKPEDKMFIRDRVHTVTGASNLNVRGDAGTTYGILAELKKGDQVPVRCV